MSPEPGITAPERIPVAIIGAGPAGLIAAIELARRGIEFRIFDRRTGPVGQSHAALLHVRTQELLDGIGITALSGSRSYPLEYVSLHAFGRALGGMRLNGANAGDLCMAGSDNPYPTPRILPQRVTEGLLVDHLIEEFDIAVERQTTLTGLAEAESGVTLTLRDRHGAENRVIADWVIGGDGAESAVRTLLGIPMLSDGLDGFEFIHADLTLAWSLPCGRAYTFVTADRYLALMPFNATGSYRLLSARAMAADAVDPTPPDADALRTMLRAVADPDADLGKLTWAARWHASHGLAERFSRGRVFLIGDAGHRHFPVGGQGMNTGMQDAINLAWKLAGHIQGHLPAEILASYEAERQPVAEDILKNTDRAFHLMAQPGDLGSFALKLFGSTVIALDRVQDRLRRVLGEVAVSYLTSPLSEDHGGSIGPIAGECAPDAIAVLAGARVTVRLLRAIKGERWNLLLFAGTEAETADPALLAIGHAVEAEFGALVQSTLITPGRQPEGWTGRALLDREHLVHDRYGVRGPALYLIRPDWYVGFRAPLGKAEALSPYLKRWLAPAIA